MEKEIVVVNKVQPIPSDEDLKKYFAPRATDKEFFEFSQLCKIRNLNPVIKEVYFIKYGDSAGQIVVGKDAILKRAKKQPDYRGFHVGYLLKDGSEAKFPVGDVVGAYCDVYIENLKPVRSVALMSEYNTKQSLWKTKPMTMIRKVCVAQSHREAFPEEFSGMYEQEEMGVPELKNVTPSKDELLEKVKRTNNHKMVFDGLKESINGSDSIDSLKEAWEKVVSNNIIAEEEFNELVKLKDEKKDMLNNHSEIDTPSQTIEEERLELYAIISKVSPGLPDIPYEALQVVVDKYLDTGKNSKVVKDWINKEKAKDFEDLGIKKDALALIEELDKLK